MSAFANWKLLFDGRYPIYEQIIKEFRRSLVRGEIQPGERIPSIRDMAILLKVNTNTVQRAYQEVEREQLIYSQRGTGYFVMDDEKVVPKIKQEMVHESVAQFVNEMASLGYSGEDIVQEVHKHLEGGNSDGSANRTKSL